MGLDVIDGLLNQRAERAGGPHQVYVVDRSNSCVWVYCRDFDVAFLMLLNDHVAEQDRTNVVVGLDRSVSQWQVAGAENDVGTAIDREMSPQGMTQVDLG
jgi:hypothetical protein